MGYLNNKFLVISFEFLDNRFAGLGKVVIYWGIELKKSGNEKI